MNTRDNEVLRQLLHECEQVRNNEQSQLIHKNKAYYEIFCKIIEYATNIERLYFTTLFSRIVYLGTRFNLPKILLHYMHMYRKSNERNEVNSNLQQYTNLGEYICFVLLQKLFDVEVDYEYKILKPETAQFFVYKKPEHQSYLPIIEGVVYEINEVEKYLIYVDENDPSSDKKAMYDITGRNELFNPNIKSLINNFSLPIHVNFLDNNIDIDGNTIFTAIVIQPDRLIDVTSIAECFKDYGTEPALYLISKFKPNINSVSLLLGNAVNDIFTQLIDDPDTDIQSILPQIFQRLALSLSMLEDNELISLLDKLKFHHANLKNVVATVFTSLGIHKERIYLESSFYSRQYGLQGRLDMLHESIKPDNYDIIELKSGKVFKPNAYKLNASHYIQTLLYHLIIKSTFGPNIKCATYVLYSNESTDQLRYATPTRAQQYEALKTRNDIIAIESALSKCDENNAILNYLNPAYFPKMRGFNLREVELFYHVYKSLDAIERSYFDHFTAFIAREHELAKIGEHGIDKINGVAGLWLETLHEKKMRFGILQEMSIVQNLSNTFDPCITLQRHHSNSELASFRNGDIVVLYPTPQKSNATILDNQIFKGSITHITHQEVTVKLRNRQYNQQIFRDYIYWNLEADVLDSGYTHMYKNLFQWSCQENRHRHLLLGRISPGKVANNTKSSINYLDASKYELLNKIINASDYFLLWGPPGTGKTSIMLRALAEHYYLNTQEQILLLAYTNRAVDEICDAISMIDGLGHHFVRIGSRAATNDRYHHRLIDQITSKHTSRHQFLEMIHGCKVFVSTVASIYSKMDLFSIKSFDTVIIDEASQILEPNIIGLLSHFKKFILIGDHQQLPAVVLQRPEDSKITNSALNALGFYDRRSSFFERLYTQCKTNDWHHAFGILEYQGRMHQELMIFPNTHFYENNLKTIPEIVRQRSDYFFKIGGSSVDHLLSRRIFIDTPIDVSQGTKTNVFEAQQCIEVIKSLKTLYTINNMTMHENSIGIITPYRAQIALINQHLEELPNALKDYISVDTVERYQGSARDIIIISFCVNHISQLANLVTLSIDGIDRKLNVALTRAKEHIILIGNKSILSQNEIYAKLIDSYTHYQ